MKKIRERKKKQHEQRQGKKSDKKARDMETERGRKRKGGMGHVESREGLREDKKRK